MHLHHHHSAEKSRVALVSIFASAGLVVTKFIVAIITGSLALLVEALHSLMDLAATMITYFAVRWADRPADRSHHYGHGKVESLAALLEVALLFVLAAFAIWESLSRLGGESHEVSAPPLAIFVLLISIVVDFFRARALQKTARETSSQALEADSLHFVSDMWASIAALLGLVAIAFGYHQADAIAALAVAGIIIFISIGLCLRTIQTLLDAAPEGGSDLIEKLVCEVSGVVNVSRVRMREVGAQKFCEIFVQVARTLPLQRVEEMKQEVIGSIHKAFPQADISVVTEAIALEEETVMERIMMIAARQRAFVHHLTVQQFEDRLAIGLDLEIDEELPLSQAHETATRLEMAIVREFGPGTEVETHIEPLEDLGDIYPASEEQRLLVESLVKNLALGVPSLSDIHSLRLRQTRAGQIVILHCYMPPHLSVREVHHTVDALERELRTTHPDIIRVLIHAEPNNAPQHHH